jgi:HEPN domain-containing protein
MSAIDPDIAAQWAEARRWIAKAVEDRRSAVLVLADDPPLLDPAAYHCQQAAEKLLKALLAAAGVAIPKSHDLQRLAALVVPLFPGIIAIIEAVSDLTPWGTATRYPDLEAEIGVMAEDIRDALISLDELHTAINALDPTDSN